jgi:hypothetical protein
LLSAVPPVRARYSLICTLTGRCAKPDGVAAESEATRAPPWAKMLPLLALLGEGATP